MAEALAKHYSPGPAPPEMKRATDRELFDFDSKLGTASHFVQFLPLRLGEKLLVPKLGRALERGIKFVGSNAPIPSFFEIKEAGGVCTLSEKNRIVGF